MSGIMAGIIVGLLAGITGLLIWIGTTLELMRRDR